MTENTENKQSILPSKYQINYPYHRKYILNRYAIDEDFRNKTIAINVEYNKTRYVNDPQFRQRIKDNVKAFRERKKLERLNTQTLIST